MNVPFFSEKAEAELVERIGTMSASGVCLGYDPVSMTACYVLVRVCDGQLPIMTRWNCEGPVDLPHARQMVEEIKAAVEADEERIDLGHPIN